MVKGSFLGWMSFGLIGCLVGFGKPVDGLIEIVEEQRCHDEEFRLTCRELETHIAILEVWYTSTEDLLQNTTSSEENRTNPTRGLGRNDNELDKVYVYSSLNHNGYYETVNRTNFNNSTQWSTKFASIDSVNDTFDLVNDTFDVPMDFVNRTNGCGVMGYLRSFASWKEGERRTPSIVRDTSINLRAPVSYRSTDEEVQHARENVYRAMSPLCAGVNHCSFILREDYPASKSWVPGVLYVKYACFDDSVSVHYCNREVMVGETGAESEGYVRTPGYPHFYIGDECRWLLRVNPEQRLRITFLDISLRSIGPFEDECMDYVSVIESSTREVLLSSCDQVELPLHLVSKSNAVEVVVQAKSKGAFPKRGILLHYKSTKCVTLPEPSNGYLVYRNDVIAHYMCNVNHVFPDSHKRARIAWCYEDNRWNDTVPSCIEYSSASVVSNSSAGGAPGGDTKMAPNEANVVVDIVIPSLLITALFTGNALIVFIIYMYRKRKGDYSEDEFNTIPLNVNGVTLNGAGNAV